MESGGVRFSALEGALHHDDLAIAARTKRLAVSAGRRDHVFAVGGTDPRADKRRRAALGKL